MKRIIQLFAVAIFSFLAITQATPAADDVPATALGQIYPVDGPIQINSEPSHVYVYYEGEEPNWKEQRLEKIVRQSQAVIGDGTQLTFTPGAGTAFHLVREEKSAGLLQLYLVGSVWEGFSYIIEQAGNEILAGVVDSDKLNAIPPLLLPQGSYTFYAFSGNYSTDGKLPFEIVGNDTVQSLDIALREPEVVLNLATSPQEIAQGKTVLINRVDAITDNETPYMEISAESSLTLPEGLYTIYFPRIDRYLQPGDKGYMGKYNFTKDLSPIKIVGEYKLFVGDLAVTYSAEGKSDALDQVQFWLTDLRGDRTRYPLRDTVSKDVLDGKRLVLITDLEPGEYSLQFVNKNNKALFKMPPRMDVVVASGEVTEVIADLDVQYGGVDVLIDLAESELFPQHPPLITLEDPTGRIIQESSEGYLKTKELFPGQYVLQFGPTEGYFAPDPITIDVFPNKMAGPFVGVYEQDHNFVAVTYDTGPHSDRLDRVRFWLVDSDDNRTIYPKDNQLHESSDGPTRTVFIPGVQEGSYSIEFLVPNRDALFEEVPIIGFTKKNGEMLSLRQSIVPRYATTEVKINLDHVKEPPTALPVISLVNKDGELVKESLSGELVDSGLVPGAYEIVFGEIPGVISPDPIKFVLTPKEHAGPFIGIYGVETVDFSLASNANQQWILYNHGKLIMTGEGPLQAVKLPAAHGYLLKSAPVHGFEVIIDPPSEFSLEKAHPFKAVIQYNEGFGSMIIDAPMADGTPVIVTLVPVDYSGSPATPLEIKLVAKDHLLWYTNEHLPVGEYTISYALPSQYRPIPPKRLHIFNNETVMLNPEFLGYQNLEVKTNISDASFSLIERSDARVIGTGSGRHFTFEGLTPGIYDLEFLTPARDEYLSPAPLEINIVGDQSMSVVGEYTQLGAFTVSSNIKGFSVSISGEAQGLPSFVEHVDGTHKTYHLPVGKYHVDFLPFKGPQAARYGGTFPEGLDFVVRSARVERIHGIYEPKKGSLVVSSNLSSAAFTVTDITDAESPLVVGRFRGEYAVIPFTYVGRYEVMFEDVANYIAPQSAVIHIKDGQREEVGGVYLPMEKVASIPRGSVIVGDIFGDGAPDERPSRTVDLAAYSIGIYEVTNAQYAKWLTRAHEEGKIEYVRSSALRGQVKDLSGRLLCETYEADRDSQIRADVSGNDVVFYPSAGREDFPVIEVSWYGANMYCQDNGYSLPTEAQWEKAAGMEQSALGRPLKKFRYGFGLNDVNAALANYMDKYGATRGVRSKTIGFYNGINLLEYSSSIESQVERDPSLVLTQYGTNAAVSPYGLYDMSGNVREWVGDWYSPDYYRSMPAYDPKGPNYGVKKVTKGGSYDSFPYELRVAARMPLPPETTDAYTGFRIVISQNTSPLLVVKEEAERK